MSLRSVLFASASLLMLPYGALAADAEKPITRAELPALVRAAVLKDPEMLTEAIKLLHDKQQENAQKDTKDALGKKHDELFKDTVSPSVGPKDADVVVVEFFDYHCGYCKHMLPTVVKLIKEDKKVRVVFREFPILSADSALAARAALAVNKVAPAKYFEYHSELMNANGKYDEVMLTGLAKKVGVDEKKFKAAYDDKAVSDQLEATRALAENLGIRGTPALVFPDKMLPGAVPYDDLQKLVDDQRKAGTK